MCDKYLLSYCRESITEILKNPDETKHFPVEINFVELSGTEPNLGNDFLIYPEKSLEEWNKAIHKVQTSLMLQTEENYVFKKHTHFRMHGLPWYPELNRTKLPQNDDTNKFLQVSGTVVRITAVKMMEHKRQYICTKCKFVMTASAEYETKNLITVPTKCDNPEGCQGRNIISMGELDADSCKDYQEIRMQETGGKRDVGTMPHSMWVTLEDDLVDSCQPGDNIIVCGLVKRRHGPFQIGKKIEVELVIKANHLQVNNNSIAALAIKPGLRDMFQGFWLTYSDTPLAARDIILKSICPELFGLYIVKLAMAVVLAGGSSLQDNSNTGVKVRTEPHLLLVGDPGTGKSELLRFASKVIPRSVLTTGVGSTAAGLTTAAVMENGEWQLEGGALVLSDGGICCIDEFNTIKEHDRTSIHEAMEQQTISVAKAGIVCKLNTRCSVLAATNPKGKLDPSQPVNIIVALATPLLSRFDLILLLKDTFDEEWDNQLLDFIFSSSNNDSVKLSESINWTIETLQAYFAVIKKNHPVLTEDSNMILGNYYQAQRKNCYNKSRTTVRLLDSLVRLSQGHARLMFHEEVEIVDAVTALILVETSMEAGTSVFGLSFNMRNDFPHDPTSNYQELVQIILKRLDLNDLLEKEIERMEKKKPGDGPGPHGGNNGNSPTVKTESKFFHIKDKNENNYNKCFNKLIHVEKDETLGEGPSGIKPKTNRSILKETGNNENNIEKTKTSEKNAEDGRMDTEDKIADFGEKENDFIKPISKRTKSKKDNDHKKIKKREEKINDDLVALMRMPSINDVFRMDDCDEDDGFGPNFDENIIQENVVNAEEKSLRYDSNMDAMREELTTNGTNDNKVEMTAAAEKIQSTKSDRNIDDSLKATKVNRFNKFRFIAKDNQEKEQGNPLRCEPVNDIKPKNNQSGNSKPEPTEDLPALSPSSPGLFNFEGDISFGDAVTSTQVQNCPTHENDEVLPNPEPAIKTCVLDGTKAREVVIRNPSSSAFETQEDLDLDLDI